MNANKEALRKPVRIILEFDNERFIESLIENPLIIEKLKDIKKSL
jgi:hypothetical protein